MNYISVVSHWRSGTHLLIETLERHFDVEVVAQHHGPLDTDGENNDTLMGAIGDYVYILRDVRDVLVSYYMALTDRSNAIIDNFPWMPSRLKHSIEFSEYIRGIVNLMTDEERTSHYSPEASDPIDFWLRNTIWWEVSESRIKYEDLVLSPTETILNLSSMIGMPIKEGIEISPVREIVGPLGGYKGRPGTWVEHWSKDDLGFLYDKAGIRMKELGYI